MTRFQKLVENIQQPLPIMPDESEEIKAKLGALQNTPSQSDTTKELAKLGVHEYDAIPTLAELGYPEPSDKGKGLVFPGLTAPVKTYVRTRLSFSHQMHLQVGKTRACSVWRKS